MAVISLLLSPNIIPPHGKVSVLETDYKIQRSIPELTIAGDLLIFNATGWYCLEMRLCCSGIFAETPAMIESYYESADNGNRHGYDSRNIQHYPSTMPASLFSSAMIWSSAGSRWMPIFEQTSSSPIILASYLEPQYHNPQLIVTYLGGDKK